MKKSEINTYSIITKRTPEVGSEEFIIIEYSIEGNKDGEYKTIVAPDCRVFIMGNSGKTIDSLICN